MNALLEYNTKLLSHMLHKKIFIINEIEAF